MSLSEDLQKLSLSVTEDGDKEYQKFKKGELKLILVGDTSNGYDEAETWVYFCDRGKLFLDVWSNIGVKEIPFILAPAIFYNPLFTKTKMVPYEEILKKWIDYQKKENKYKVNQNYSFLYEFREDYALRYSKNGRLDICENIYGLLNYSPDDFLVKTMSKENFFNIS